MKSKLDAISAVGYLVMVGALLAQLATHNLFSPSPLAIAAQVGAVLLMLWARLTFGRRSFHATATPTEGRLVTNGPYRLIRHPIYTAVTLFSAAGAVAHGSVRSGIIFACLLGGAVLRIFSEQTLLRARYPDYRQYSSATWRMIPFVF